MRFLILSVFMLSLTLSMVSATDLTSLKVDVLDSPEVISAEPIEPTTNQPSVTTGGCGETCRRERERKANQIIYNSCVMNSWQEVESYYLAYDLRGAMGVISKPDYRVCSPNSVKVWLAFAEMFN